MLEGKEQRGIRKGAKGKRGIGIKKVWNKSMEKGVEGT